MSGVKQEKFSEANLAEDLFQLFGDFFAGEAKLNKNTIEVAFLNGQRFNIKVTKTKAKLK